MNDYNQQQDINQQYQTEILEAEWKENEYFLNN
jgi:hypothetical protein